MESVKNVFPGSYDSKDYSEATDSIVVPCDHNNNLQLYMNLDNEATNRLREMILRDATSSSLQTSEEVGENSMVFLELNGRKIELKYCDCHMISLSDKSRETGDELNSS